MPTPQIQLTQVSKRFGDFTAVAPLDLAIDRGEFVVLLGPSGCGKTTTLRMVAGLEDTTAGTIHIAGRDVTVLPAGERDIAFVFQMFALYPHLTAEQNIAFPLRAARLPRADIRRRTDEVIRRLGLNSLRHFRPRQLSGGDQQRISLARAMVRQPQAFLMDEPLGTLDADQREQTRVELRAIHNELGATTVFVTHDQLEAMSLADRIAIMRDGRLLQCASPRQVYDHPADLFVAHFVGSPGMNFLPATRSGGHATVAGMALTVPWPPAAPRASATLTVGIRPEYIRVGPPGAPARVDHVEQLGAYDLLTLLVDAHTIKARVSGGLGIADGATIPISIDPAGLRLFDSASGRAIA